MRLIDADKIRYRDMSDGQVNGGVWYTFIEDIQKQPAVDAIPIEWIEQYINRFGGSNKLTYMHKEHLKTLIKDWEKENG